MQGDHTKLEDQSIIKVVIGEIDYFARNDSLSKTAHVDEWQPVCGHAKTQMK